MLPIKIKHVIFMSLLIFLGSCKPILLKLYGIKNPGIEDEKSITTKALKFKLDTSNLVTVSSNDFLQVLEQQSIPEAAIYDKNGKYIEYRETDSSCNAGLFAFIPALNLNAQYNQPDKPDLFAELSKFRDLKGNPLSNLNPADFYVLIYWTTWSGRLNKDHVKIWEDQARNNKNCHIQVVKVNLDLQSYWDAQARDKIIEVLSK